MAVTLQQSVALTDLADALYGFLPATPHPYADPNVSFPGVAHRLGLSRYWSSGSKRTAIIQLLKATLDHEANKFCPLVLEIIRTGIVYRKGEIARDEIDRINMTIARLGFKIPELHEPTFLNSLRREGPEQDLESDLPDGQLQEMQKQFDRIISLPPHDRGFAFETFLSDLFAIYRLAPKGSFRLHGEQIDGSFQYQGDTYLLEARWRNEVTGIEDLLAFSGKVAGKSSWARGVFVSYAGFSVGRLAAFQRGRPVNIICLDGLDLHHILSGRVDLRTVLERKIRRAAETNDAFVRVRDLFPELDLQ